MTAEPITILGAGSWGTALALYLGRRSQPVHLWSIDRTEIEAMLRDHTNERVLPGIPLPATIHPTCDLKHAIAQSKDILIVVPSVAYRKMLGTIAPLLTDSHRIICATKGIDAESLKLLHDVTFDMLGASKSFAVLSGPSFAKEVAKGLPVAVDVASLDTAFLHDITERFDSPLFHIHPGSDLIGVELGGVVKNIIAILTGINDGLSYGTSARSAIITLGLQDIVRLGRALGATPTTFMGLSGLGDLILTCSDDQSRNRRLGILIGQGKHPDAAEKEIGQVIEGKQNAKLIVQLAKTHQVAMPLCEAALAILEGTVKARDIVPMLLKFTD